MPSETEKQRLFFAAVYAKKLNPKLKVSPEVAEAAKSMTTDEIKKFLKVKK